MFNQEIVPYLLGIIHEKQISTDDQFKSTHRKYMNRSLIKNAILLSILFWINSYAIQLCIGQITIQGVEIIGHSHNDYEQKHPLETALQYQFGSIEIDIFEYNGQIVVCHDKCYYTPFK